MTESIDSSPTAVSPPEKPRKTPEELAAHIKELGMAARFLRTNLQEEYARAVEEDIANHSQDLAEMGASHLLASYDGSAQPAGVRTILPHH